MLAESVVIHIDNAVLKVVLLDRLLDGLALIESRLRMLPNGLVETPSVVRRGYRVNCKVIAALCLRESLGEQPEELAQG